MTYIDNSCVVYRMGREAQPVQTVSSGATVRIQTYDCFRNQLMPSAATMEQVDFDLLNPATGPIAVKGANPGDTLKIEILKIELDATGCTEIDQTFGVLRDRVRQPVIRRISVSDDQIHYSRRLTLRMKPMIGVIGVAPAGDSVPTDTPGNHGGNMDCTLIAQGATLYLPVFVPGALLAVGDLHACMGDGEIAGCGLEISGHVELRLTVLPTASHAFPVVVDGQSIAVIASEPSVEMAWKTASRYMYEVLTEDTDMSSDDAIMLQSLAADLAICQTINPQATVRMTFPLDYASAYGYQVL